MPDSQQPAYLELLLDPGISCVSIDARQGFGKTFWAVATGLYHLSKGHYKKMLYVASHASTEKKMATVPGNKEKKLYDKMRPFYDTIASLLITKNGKEISDRQADEYVARLVQGGLLELDTPSDIKGRSISNTFMIMDEFHFYNLYEGALLVGRTGQGSKAVCLADKD